MLACARNPASDPWDSQRVVMWEQPPSAVRAGAELPCFAAIQAQLEIRKREALVILMREA